MITIAPSEGKDRGVFATQLIVAGALIEEAPVVVVPETQMAHLMRTVLKQYYFEWGADWTEAAILLGMCALCNHSFAPNATFTFHFEKRTISFHALRKIAPGEEITINYNGDPVSQEPVYFVLPP